MSLNILILGDNGSGKSTAARIATLALIDAGFYVDLDDKDDCGGLWADQGQGIQYYHLS